MARYYLMNNVMVGTTAMYAGTLVDDTTDDVVAIQAVGGELEPAATPGLAAAAALVAKKRKRGAPPEEFESIMNAALDKEQEDFDHTDLASTATGKGGDLIGLYDPGSLYISHTVGGALREAAGGGAAVGATIVATGPVLLSAGNIYLVDATAGPIVATMSHTGAATGRRFSFVRVDATANTVTFNDGATALLVLPASQYGTAGFIFDATGWQLERAAIKPVLGTGSRTILAGNADGGQVTSGTTARTFAWTGSAITITGNADGGQVSAGTTARLFTWTGSASTLTGNADGGALAAGTTQRTLTWTGSALTLTGAADGWTFAGGTTSRTLTFTGSAATLQGNADGGQFSAGTTARILSWLGSNLTLQGNADGAQISGGTAPRTLSWTGGALAFTVPVAGVAVNLAGNLTTTGGAVGITVPVAGGSITLTGNFTMTGAANVQVDNNADGGDIVAGVTGRTLTWTGSAWTLTGNADGGSIAGGTTSRTFTWTGSAATLTGNADGGSLATGTTSRTFTWTGSGITVTGNADGGQISAGTTARVFSWTGGAVGITAAAAGIALNFAGNFTTTGGAVTVAQPAAAGAVPYASGAGVYTNLPIGAPGAICRVNAGATAPEYAAIAAFNLVHETVTLTQAGDLAGLPALQKVFTKNLGAVTAANGKLVAVVVNATVLFTDGGVATYTLEMGEAAADTNEIRTAFDVATASAVVFPGNVDAARGVLGFDMAPCAAKQESITIRSSADLNTATAGSVTVDLYYIGIA